MGWLIACRANPLTTNQGNPEVKEEKYGEDHRNNKGCNSQICR